MDQSKIRQVVKNVIYKSWKVIHVKVKIESDNLFCFENKKENLSKAMIIFATALPVFVNIFCIFPLPLWFDRV